MFGFSKVDWLVWDIFVSVNLNELAQTKNVLPNDEKKFPEIKINKFWVPGCNYVKALQNHGGFLFVFDM